MVRLNDEVKGQTRVNAVRTIGLVQPENLRGARYEVFRDSVG